MADLRPPPDRRLQPQQHARLNGLAPSSASGQRGRMVALNDARRAAARLVFVAVVGLLLGSSTARAAPRELTGLKSSPPSSGEWLEGATSTNGHRQVARVFMRTRGAHVVRFLAKWVPMSCDDGRTVLTSFGGGPFDTSQGRFRVHGRYPDGAVLQLQGRFRAPSGRGPVVRGTFVGTAPAPGTARGTCTSGVLEWSVGHRRAPGRAPGGRWRGEIRDGSDPLMLTVRRARL